MRWLRWLTLGLVLGLSLLPAASAPTVSVVCVAGCSSSAGTGNNGSSGIATTADNAKSMVWTYGYNGATWDQLQVDGSKFLKVNCAAGCAGGTFNNNADAVATSATNGQSASWLYGFNGATWDRLRVDGSKFLQVNCAAGCSGGTFNNNADAVATSATNGQSASWLYGFNGATWDRLQVDASKFLKVNCSAGCSGGTFNNNADAVATSATNGQAAAWLYGYNGATWDRLQVDASKFLKVNCSAGCSGGTFNNNADNVATSATNGQSAAWNYGWDGVAWDRMPGDSSNGQLVNLGNNNDVTITDGVNVATVKAGSNAPNSTDTALVVALNPNNAANTTPYLFTGDIDHDVANTLKNIQVAGNAQPYNTPPTLVSANGDRARIWVDRAGAVVTRPRRIKETYNATFRLAEAAARLDQTFTQVANTNKQWATLHHTAGAAKELRLQRVSVFISAWSVASQGVLELRSLNAAPATGNPAVTPRVRTFGGTAAEAVALYLPTTAGTETAVNSPLASYTIDQGVLAAVSTVNPFTTAREIILYSADLEDDQAQPPTCPVATLCGWAVMLRTVGAPAVRLTVNMVFVEETP